MNHRFPNVSLHQGTLALFPSKAPADKGTESGDRGLEGCSRALASRGTDSQVHCNTLPTCCASSGSHHPRGRGTEGEQQAQHYGTHECGSTAALRPFLPCQTASPAAALICHFQSLPSHVMKRRGMGSGRRLVVEGGGSIYM